MELFKELEPSDLDYLGIMNPEHRAKLLAAVQLLHAIDSNLSDEIAGSSSENDGESRLKQVQKKNSLSPFGRRHFPRDSGCYEGSLLPNINSTKCSTDAISVVDEQVVSQCANDILKRVEAARNSIKEFQQQNDAKKSFMKRGLLGGAATIDDLCSRVEGGALSEKSSDSGVSSSSLSGPFKTNL